MPHYTLDKLLDKIKRIDIEELTIIRILTDTYDKSPNDIN